jgi:hypothetical protein
MLNRSSTEAHGNGAIRFLFVMRGSVNVIRPSSGFAMIRRLQNVGFQLHSHHGVVVVTDNVDAAKHFGLKTESVIRLLEKTITFKAVFIHVPNTSKS